MIGEKLRSARGRSGMSLTEVAGRVEMSVATLSRIETGKQSVDAETVISLARIIGIAPALLFADSEDGTTPESIARRIASMDARERAAFWRELSAERKPRRNGTNGKQLAAEIEEMLAQIDFLKEELETLRRGVNPRRR